MWRLPDSIRTITSRRVIVRTIVRSPDRTKVEIDPVEFEGAVSAVAGNVITISSHGEVTRFDVGTGTAHTSNGSPSTLAAIVVGVKIEGSGLPDSTTATATATITATTGSRSRCGCDGVSEPAIAN